jgi:hypothetical protein
VLPSSPPAPTYAGTPHPQHTRTILQAPKVLVIWFLFACHRHFVPTIVWPGEVPDPAYLPCPPAPCAPSRACTCHHNPVSTAADCPDPVLPNVRCYCLQPTATTRFDLPLLSPIRPLCTSACMRKHYIISPTRAIPYTTSAYMYKKKTHQPHKYKRIYQCTDTKNDTSAQIQK